VWRYVYRAVVHYGQIIDVFVAKRRNILAPASSSRSTVIRCHGFIQNLRRRHYELGVEARHDRLRVAAAFDDFTEAT
jgi:hypothetical protein